MRARVPAALGGVVVSAYAFFYYLSSTGSGTGNSFILVNSIGLAAVVVGIVAAGFILRRATPHS